MAVSGPLIGVELGNDLCCVLARGRFWHQDLLEGVLHAREDACGVEVKRNM